MTTKMLIDATHAEETRVVVVDGNKVEEFDFETLNKRQLAGNIYLAKVTRVEPSLQAAFVDYGGNRHGFLAFSEIHPDYYQIPVADRKALLEEERAYAEEMEAEEQTRHRRRQRPAHRAAAAENGDAVRASDDIPGMTVIDMSDEDRQEDRPDDRYAASRLGDEPVVSEAAPAAPAANGEAGANGEEPYVAADHASDSDPDIESVADEDVAEEIRQPRKPRPRRYKIQEVIKVRQIMLVQVVKEERGNKGAALTTYLSLAGRYCVLMPNTARGGGISRKITNAVDRKKLKEIAGEMEVPDGAGLIIRTAGSQRTKSEIKRDYEYLMRLWEQVRDLTLKSIAPAPIYEEGDLIKRSIRDLYNKDIEEVLVEGEKGYRAAKDFMKMIMPSHAKNVKPYAEPLPLFARFQVESYLGAMFNPTVQLKSGGYIVIGVTEALVAIDVNSGRATKEGSIEETALKTNLEAAEEVARQLRLRDLAGLIVIDFIDMEERRNNAAVEKRLKEKLKTDRARIQVGRISGFGLLEMSRQRLRPGMLESTTQPCAHCHGTGIIRSDDSLSLSILRQIEEEGTRKRSREVLLKAPVAVVNFLMNQKREHIAQIEARYGLSVRIEADPSLISPDFSLEKFKTATRFVPEVTSPVVSVNTTMMEELDEEEIVEDEDEDEDDVAEARPEGQRAQQRAEGEDEGDPSRKKKRRRRRRRRSGQREGEGVAAAAGEAPPEDLGAPEAEAAPVADAEAADAAAGEAAAPRRRRTRGGKGARPAEAAEAAGAQPVEAVTAEAAPAAEEAVAGEAVADKPKARRSRAKKADAPADGAETVAADTAAETDAPKPRATRSRARKPKADAEAVAAEPAPQPVAEAAPDHAPAPEPVIPAATGRLQPDPAAEEVLVEAEAEA
ncbi:MAG: ribonuclease E/G, partial [Proteobacteria bacterium]|nr:ribonuclease E/G [Pseudomonadota bacterium]